MLDLNDNFDPMNLTCRTFHSIAAEYTVFSSAQRTSSRIDHMIYHKPSVSKLNKVEIIPGIFSYHNGMKLETCYKRTLGKFTSL